MRAVHDAMAHGVPNGVAKKNRVTNMIEHL